MKRITLLFLQVVIVLLGIVVLTLMLWEPHLEGRNEHATLFEVYFQDPFLAYVYASSTLFFMVLYQVFTFLGYIGHNELFLQSSGKALRTIRYCAVGLVLLIVGAEAYLFVVQRGKDDIAGGVAIGLFMVFVFVLVTVSATLFEKRLHKKFQHHSIRPTHTSSELHI
jgi:hypothetical protein